MSQRVVSQIVERTCDGCGKVETYDLAAPSQETLLAMCEWYMIGRQFPSGEAVKAQACSLECVPVVAVKIATPSSAPEQDAPIDLDSLRAGGPDVTQN
jgi:hypothetical protein